MRALSLLAVGLLATAAHAGFAGNSQTYTDSQNDLFDNGLGNLDIASVTLADDGVNLTISVTTRDFQSWTKYMMYFDTASGGTNSNGWSRPVNLTSDIEHYIGSWVDAPSDNAQFWSWGGSWNQTGTLTNSVSGTTVSWTMSLASRATAVPDPIAMPMSACLSAGASLVPSPVTATTCSTALALLAMMPDTNVCLSIGDERASTRRRGHISSS